MACSDVMSWPAGVLKILHFIFNAVVFICLILYYDTTGKIPKEHGIAQMFMWVLLFGTLLVCSIILLILLIFVDGSGFKAGLLSYYVVGCSFAFVGMLAGGLYLDYWPYKISMRNSDDNKEVHGRHWTQVGTGDFARPKYFIPFIIAEICSILSFIVYLASAILNGAKGKP